VLEDYFQGLAKAPPRWEKDRFFLDLPGICGHPLRRVLPEDMAHHWKRFTEEPWPRWVEVWCPEDMHCIDVMTRHSDDPTNTLAEGFAKCVSRWWQGRIESG
jgi:hypothetical protein